MTISSDLVNQVLSLPPDQRYALAQHLLDSIDDEAAAKFDARFMEDLNRRREELLHGIEGVDDWRAELSEIENALRAGSTT